MVMRFLRPAAARREAIASAAGALGLEFVAEPPLRIRSHEWGIPSGTYETASNMVHGTRAGRGVTVFDWKSQTTEDAGWDVLGVTESTTRSKTVRLTVVGVELSAPVRSVWLRRGRRPNKSEKKHVAPTGNTELDRAFVSCAYDPDDATALADDRFARSVLDTPDVGKVHLLVTRLSVSLSRRSPDELAETIDLVIRMADSLPAAAYRRSPG